MEIQVKITQILPSRKFTTGNGENTVHCFVGVTLEQFSKPLKFDVFGDDRYQKLAIVVGGIYQISFDVESREWKENWYTTLRPWKAVRIDNDNVAPTATPQNAPETPKAPTPTTTSGDVPF